MKDKDPQEIEHSPGVTRRDFLKISGVGVAAPLLLAPRTISLAGEEVAIHGPGKVPVRLTVNQRQLTAEIEPRVTLLDALRNDFDLTGSKRVCDRGTCGACTVLMDGRPVYACSVLAIDAQGHEITTIEGLAKSGELSPIMQAFVDNDAQQCGFCTPGFVVATTSFLRQHPQATEEDLRRDLSGNFCRCGTYSGIQAVVLAGGKERAS